MKDDNLGKGSQMLDKPGHFKHNLCTHKWSIGGRLCKLSRFKKAKEDHLLFVMPNGSLIENVAHNPQTLGSYPVTGVGKERKWGRN